jgi:hypothetical protein
MSGRYALVSFFNSVGLLLIVTVRLRFLAFACIAINRRLGAVADFVNNISHIIYNYKCEFKC